MIPSRTLNLNRRTSNFNLDPEVKGELSVLPTGDASRKAWNCKQPNVLGPTRLVLPGGINFIRSFVDHAKTT